MIWSTVVEYLCHKWSLIRSTCSKRSRSIPHSWLITGFVTRLTRRVPLVEQELPTLPEHPSSSRVFSGICGTRSLIWCVCLLTVFVLFLVAIMLLVLLRFTDSDYRFGIFQLSWKDHSMNIFTKWKCRRMPSDNNSHDPFNQVSYVKCIRPMTNITQFYLILFLELKITGWQDKKKQ